MVWRKSMKRIGQHLEALFNAFRVDTDQEGEQDEKIELDMSTAINCTICEALVETPRSQEC